MNNKATTLQQEINRYYAFLRKPPANNPSEIMLFLNRVSSIQARAGSIISEVIMIKGEQEELFINEHKEEFDKMVPTKFNLLMNSSLREYKALQSAAEKLEQELTHICDNFRTIISYIKEESKLSPLQTT